MKNKAINHLKKDTVDSLKNSKTKLPNYLAAGGIVLGSTIAGISSVSAANVGGGANHDALAAIAFVFNIAAKDLTVTTDDTATPDVTTVGVGAISDNATTGDLIIASQASDDAGFIVTIASVIMDAANTAGANAITDIDNAVGDMTVTFSGAYKHDGVLTITSAEDTDSETLTVNFDGLATLIAASNLVADNTGSINAVFSAAAIFTAGIDLKQGATGTSTLTFDGASAQAIGGVIIT